MSQSNFILAFVDYQAAAEEIEDVEMVDVEGDGWVDQNEVHSEDIDMVDDFLTDEANSTSDGGDGINSSSVSVVSDEGQSVVVSDEGRSVVVSDEGQSVVGDLGEVSNNSVPFCPFLIKDMLRHSARTMSTRPMLVGLRTSTAKGPVQL